MTKAASVQEYLASIPGPARSVLESLRSTIRAVAPDAQEGIAYDMPALRLKGTFLVSYAAYSRHFSLFPASQAVKDACGDALVPFLSGRATIRFTAGAPLPEALVRKIVKVRLAEVEARG